ncbi:MAG TPA: GGDEF domain-containing protein [Gammaproteobacteria bacterium]|nr:GGDEF domain-containing protein [Gammaproteobacteria bacterium]
MAEPSVRSGEVERLYAVAPIGLCYFDAEFRFRYINEWLARINGMPVDAHLGKSIRELLPDVADGIIPQIRRVFETGEPIIDGELIAQTPAHPREPRHYRHSYYPDKDAANKIVGIHCVVQDVTASKRAEYALRERNRQLEDANQKLASLSAQFKRANAKLQDESQNAAEANKRLEEAKQELQRLALFDTLTGLGNRNLFMRQIEHLIAIAERRNEEIALLAMDLDGFKEINDRLGHAAGDEVLREFGKRLARSLRKADRKFRIGGDEFAVLLEPRFGAFDGAVEVSRQIAKRVGVPMQIKGHSCSIGVSIGIAVFPDHGREPNALLRKADAAMYEAKKKQQVVAGASDVSATTVLEKLRTTD